MKKGSSLFFGNFIFVVLFFISCSNNSSEYEKIENAPLAYEDGYVGDAKCVECHKTSVDTWKGSHHDLAMQVANENTVLGNFNDQKITLDGVSYHFTKNGSEFWVHIKEIDGTEKDYKISYAFGFTPLQQYLIDFDGGRKQVLRVTWNTIQKKWFHQYSGDSIDPHDWMHWTESSQNWNTMCAECHSTNLKKNYDTESDTFHTTYSSINVSCESCHGPAERHLNWAKIHKKGETFDNAFIKKGTSQLSQINMCAPCHSRRTKLEKNLMPNEQFTNQFLIQDLDTEYYYPDGQIKEEDYVTGSFLQSKMYHENVKCSDCHNPHSLKLKKQGNDLCLQCHKPSYNEKSHHFHLPNTDAAQCVNCHMTGKIYMGNDFRRDHSFRVPRPDQSVTYSTPNACNGCHKDKTSKWASDKIVAWYGPTRSKHYSDNLLISSKATISEAEKKKLLTFINDLSYPAIARATVINNITISNQHEFSEILKSLSDKSPLVRFNALQKISSLSPEDCISIAGKHINDSVKLVRIGAVQLLVGLPQENLQTINSDQLNRAKKEYEQMLFANSDFSLGRLSLGDYFLQNNQVELAIKNYKKALEKDKLLFPAYSNLATCYSMSNNPTEALNTLNQWIKLEPNSSYAYYLRGLLNFELKNDSAGVADLKKSSQIDPTNTRTLYNLAVYFYQTKNFAQAELFIKKALQIDSRNADFNNLASLIKAGK